MRVVSLRPSFLVVLAAVGAGAAAAVLGVPAAAPPTPRSAGLPESVRKTAIRLREQAFAGTRAAEWVRSLSDTVGPRLAGSAGDTAAVAWGVATMKALGLSNVRAESVTVKVWQRGTETGEVVEPVRQRLVLTALGGSVGTPETGIEGEVIEFSSLEAFDAKRDSAQGKIVFFNKPMERSSTGSGYGNAVDVRGSGAARAGKAGALGVLIRSVGTDRNRTPHTGSLHYEEGTPRIPAAALSVPDAELLARLLREGRPVRVRFTLTCGERPDAESANVVGEIPGRASKSPEIVLLGAHLDSWDLGTGAIDDAAGCGIVLEAARLIGQLRQKPMRTIRVVLFANEENGLAGAKGYVKAHEAELPRHVAALESDGGTGRPTGLSWNTGPASEPLVREIAAILEPLGATELVGNGDGGADVGELKAARVPLFSIRQDSSRYFDYHHTANDTFDKIEPDPLDRNAAAVAAFAWIAAEIPEPFERIPAAARVERP